MKFTNTILIDDDPILRFSIKKMLTEYLAKDDFNSFASGYDAIDYLQGMSLTKNTKCLILLDLNMPLLNGRDFIRLFEEKMKGKEQHFSICILSSTHNEKAKHELLAHTLVDEFICKPITLGELKMLLQDKLTKPLLAKDTAEYEV